MLDSGFFHADPHAGNLLATDDGRLCYLDFGMMSYLEERQRVSIIEAVVHLVNRDFEALADLYVRMGFIKAGTDVKPIVRGLQDALPDVLDAPVSELNVKNVASSSRCDLGVPPFYAIEATRVRLTMTWVVSTALIFIRMSPRGYSLTRLLPKTSCTRSPSALSLLNRASTSRSSGAWACWRAWPFKSIPMRWTIWALVSAMGVRELELDLVAALASTRPPRRSATPSR